MTSLFQVPQGLAKGKQLKRWVAQLQRAMPLPGHNMRAAEVADGSLLHASRSGVSRAPVGEFAVRVADGLVTVQPGTVTASADNTSWQGTPQWAGGGSTDTPIALPSGLTIVALRCVAQHFQPPYLGPIVQPNQPVEVHLSAWPLPANDLDNVATGQVVWWVPLALLVAGKVHQLTLGPLITTANSGWPVTRRDLA